MTSMILCRCPARAGADVFGRGRVLVAFGFVVCLASATAGRQSPRFHADARVVVLHVVVTNTHGALVPGLDRDAFKVFENGRPQSITLFGCDDVPVSLGLVIDNSGSMRSSRAAVEAAALAFVRASNSLDDMFVVNFADDARIDVPFTHDLHALETGVARVDSIGGTALRDAILLAEGYLRDHASQDRRALLVITDGRDNASAASERELRRVVERSGTALHAVTFTPVGRLRNGRGEADELVDLTRRSGGIMREAAAATDVREAVLDIARRIRSSYTIGYTPENRSFDGSYRAVRVVVPRPDGLTAHTRAGYWATPSAETSFIRHIASGRRASGLLPDGTNPR